MEKTVLIPFRPWKHQQNIIELLKKKKNFVLVCHRRAGKTYTMGAVIIKDALSCPYDNPNYIYACPKLIQTLDVAWEPFCRLAQYLPGFMATKTPTAKITFQTSHGIATIFFKGLDTHDAFKVRGNNCEIVVLDEGGYYSSIDLAAIQPLLTNTISEDPHITKYGKLIITGTPNLTNDFYNLYEMATACTDDTWGSLKLTVLDTDVFDDEAIAYLQATLPPKIFAREYMCDFHAESDNSLIPLDLVLKAEKRGVPEYQLEESPLIFGVDVSRGGEDATVIVKRRGLYMYPPLVFNKLSPPEAYKRLLAEIQNHERNEDPVDRVFIDIAVGEHLVYELQKTPYAPLVSGVNFGDGAFNAIKYANKRAEIWDSITQWLQDGGSIPTHSLEWDDKCYCFKHIKSDCLRKDLTMITFKYDTYNRILLELKDKLKQKLGGRSPDRADALALTFSAPVPSKSRGRILPRYVKNYAINVA